MTTNLHSLTGAYALNALDDVERAAFERHLRSCADCQAEVASLADAASALASDPRHRAPDSMRGATLAAAGATPQVGDAKPPSQRPRRRLLTWVASAAAVAVIAVAGVGAFLRAADNGTPGPAEAQMMSILSAPDAKTMDMPWGDGSYVVVSDSRRGAIVMMHEIAMPADGNEYQVWMVLADGTAVPSSTFMPDADGKAMAVVTGDMSHVAALAITSEPHGGSPAPTGDVLGAANL